MAIRITNDPKKNRSVTVKVAVGEVVHFRYLGSGGVWFDDPEASELSDEGGLLRV
jgi:hypothetical protein